MKAKDYVDTYNIYLSEKGRSGALAEIFKRIILEINEIAEQRKSKTDSTFISILKEQDMKWRSICNKIEGLDKEGLVNYFKIECKINIY